MFTIKQERFLRDLGFLLREHDASFNHDKDGCYLLHKGKRLPISARDKIGSKCISWHLNRK